MLKSDTLELRLSEIREGLNRLLQTENRTDEQTAEMAVLSTEALQKEPEWRAAQIADGLLTETTTITADPEVREKLELRGRAQDEGLLTTLLNGRRPSGAIEEYLQAHGCNERQIPLHYQVRPAAPALETRALTPPPATGTGVNLEPINQMVFPDGLAARLRVELKMVESGVFSTATITTGVPATAKAKSAAADATAGVLTATTSGVKRISASITMAEEDVATVGQTNYESALMEHVNLSLQNGHDGYLLTGTGVAPIPKGILLALGAIATRATTETFGSYAAVPAEAVDGVFARDMKDVLILCGLETFIDAAKLIQDNTAVSASSYLRSECAGFMASSRFAASASKVQQGIAFRSGRPGVSAAVQPIWNRLTIDDRFTLGANAERKVSVHLLLGDVLVRQPGAYKRIAFKVT